MAALLPVIVPTRAPIVDLFTIYSNVYILRFLSSACATLLNHPQATLILRITTHTCALKAEQTHTMLLDEDLATVGQILHSNDESDLMRTNSSSITPLGTSILFRIRSQSAASMSHFLRSSKLVTCGLEKLRAP